jgi:hypothetical protein
MKRFIPDMMMIHETNCTQYWENPDPIFATSVIMIAHVGDMMKTGVGFSKILKTFFPQSFIICSDHKSNRDFWIDFQFYKFDQFNKDTPTIVLLFVDEKKIDDLMPIVPITHIDHIHIYIATKDLPAFIPCIKYKNVSVSYNLWDSWDINLFLNKFCDSLKN